jgi:hypothetical protein
MGRTSWEQAWPINGGGPYKLSASKNGFTKAVALRRLPPKIEDFWRRAKMFASVNKK